MTVQKLTFTAAVILTVLAVMVWTGAADAEEAQREQARYCEGVAVWEAQAARGVPKIQRTGHADYNRTAARECPGLNPAE